jgi:hypothetical protein
MSIPCKFERSVLSQDKHEVIFRSHHPEIYDAGVDDLKALRQHLRDMRDKESTLARAKRREMRGKGPPRGGSFPGLAAAVKRVNGEVDRLQKLEERTAHVEAARRALTMRRAAQFLPRPPARDASSEGMKALQSQRRPRGVSPAKNGRVSKSTKDAQAARASRIRSVE